MKAVVRWISDEKFLGTSESGHSVVFDANGGKEAPSPLENILLSLGCCSSVDVVSILKKTRQEVKDCVVEISSTRVDTIPRVFSDIHLHFIVVGNEVNPKQVDKAVTMSAEKYCSVAKMLSPSVKITHDFEVVQQ